MTTTDPAAQVAELRALLDAATPGPWCVDGPWWHHGGDHGDADAVSIWWQPAALLLVLAAGFLIGWGLGQ